MKKTVFTALRGAVSSKSLPPLLVLAGIALAAAGIWRGEIYYVFQKAVAICLECIGIG